MSRCFFMFAETPAVSVHIASKRSSRLLSLFHVFCCSALQSVEVVVAIIIITINDTADLLSSLQEAARSFSAAFDHSQEDGFDVVCAPAALCKVLILLIAGGFQFAFY